MIKKFKRRKVYARFKDNIWAAHLAEMGTLSYFNRNVTHLLCVIDVFTKCAWIKPLKAKKHKTVLHGFIEIIIEFKRKLNKLWVAQERKFYYKPMRKCLEDNNVLMYSTHNEDKSVVAERLIKTLKDKIYKKVTANDKNLILVISIN